MSTVENKPASKERPMVANASIASVRGRRDVVKLKVFGRSPVLTDTKAGGSIRIGMIGKAVIRWRSMARVDLGSSPPPCPDRNRGHLAAQFNAPCTPA